jgi:hypothetical protein
MIRNIMKNRRIVCPIVHLPFLAGKLQIIGDAPLYIASKSWFDPPDSVLDEEAPLDEEVLVNEGFFNSSRRLQNDMFISVRGASEADSDVT